MRDAQQSILRINELEVDLRNNIEILKEQTAAAIQLSDVDFLEQIGAIEAQSAEQLRQMEQQQIYSAEQMDAQMDNVRAEILARTDSAEILSQLDHDEARQLAADQAQLQMQVSEKQSELKVLEDNASFANRLVEIQSQTASQIGVDSNAAARQLQTNYLIESGSLLRQAMQDIATANTTEGLNQAQQRHGVNEIKIQLSSNLKVLQALYQASPAWDTNFEMSVDWDSLGGAPPSGEYDDLADDLTGSGQTTGGTTTGGITGGQVAPPDTTDLFDSLTDMPAQPPYGTPLFDQPPTGEDRYYQDQASPPEGYRWAYDEGGNRWAVPLDTEVDEGRAPDVMTPGYIPDHLREGPTSPEIPQYVSRRWS
jgi:hypothetical protein